MTTPRPTKQQLAFLAAERARIARSQLIVARVAKSALHLSAKQLGAALAVERLRSVEELRESDAKGGA